MTPNVITLSTLQNRMGLFQIQLLLPDPINEKSKKLLLFFFFFFFFLFFFFNILSSFNTSLSLSLSLSHSGCFTSCLLNPVPTPQQGDFGESQIPSGLHLHGSSRIKTHIGITLWSSFLTVVLIGNSTILIKNQDPVHFGSTHGMQRC